MSHPGINNEDICVMQLENINLKEEAKFVGEIEFDLGVIDSPIYGVVHIKGTLPLVSKPGTYPLENDPTWKKETEEEAFEIISSWFIKHELNLGYKEMRDEMIRHGIRTVLCVSPPRQLNTRLLAAMTLSMVCFYMDDLEEVTGVISEFSEMNESGSSGLMDTFHQILRGEFKSLAQLPEVGFPLLKPILWFPFFTQEQLSMIPGYDSSELRHFIKGANKTYEASLILANPEFVDACSEQLFSEIRQYDVGGGAAIECVYFCEQIQLSKEIRSDLLFKSCSTIGGKLAILVNDLLGLKKDVNLDKPINRILRNVRRKGISLTEGVAEAVAEIKAMTQDMILAMDLLSQRYSDCREFVKCTKFTMDGHIFAYTFSDNNDESNAKARWGSHTFNKIYYYTKQFTKIKYQ